MISFEEHSDGRIYIRSGEKLYVESGANFAADFGKSAPALPDGAENRIYQPGIRHALSDGSSVIGGGDMPWRFGDDAIAAIDDLIARQQARQAVAAGA